jgi:hypothetical protein
MLVSTLLIRCQATIMKQLYHLFGAVEYPHILLCINLILATLLRDEPQLFGFGSFDVNVKISR